MTGTGTRTTVVTTIALLHFGSRAKNNKKKGWGSWCEPRLEGIVQSKKKKKRGGGGVGLNQESYVFSTRFDVYETLCPQQMLVHKGGQIKNWMGFAEM